MKHQNLYPNMFSGASSLDSFGMLIRDRTYSSVTYRFGFNGQEKDDELSGEGNTNTAEYWEYDTRLGRRWNLDPEPQINISDYSCFKNNPLILVDKNGAAPSNFIKNLVMKHKKSQFEKFERRTARSMGLRVANGNNDGIHARMRALYGNRRFMYVKSKYTDGDKFKSNGTEGWYGMKDVMDFDRRVTDMVTPPPVPIGNGPITVGPGSLTADPGTGIPEWSARIPNPANSPDGRIQPAGTTVSANITNTYTTPIPVGAVAPVNIFADQDPTQFGNGTVVAPIINMAAPNMTVNTGALIPGNFLTVGIVQNPFPVAASNVSIQFVFNLPATPNRRTPKIVSWSNIGSSHTFRAARNTLRREL